MHSECSAKEEPDLLSQDSKRKWTGLPPSSRLEMLRACRILGPPPGGTVLNTAGRQEVSLLCCSALCSYSVEQGGRLGKNWPQSVSGSYSSQALGR